MENKPSYEQLEQRVKELSEQLIRDPTTGLYNRHFYNINIGAILKQLEKNKRGIGVLFIDIDNLKKVNDESEDHTIGDKLIQETARILEGSTRSLSARVLDYTIRWGGDEFVVLLSNAGINTGKIVMKRINRGIRKYNKRSKRDGKSQEGKIIYPLAISAGYAYGEYYTQDIMDEAIALADKRMYEEKRKK